MNIEIQEQFPVKQECYELVITTMEGDADDFHSVEYYFPKNEEEKLRELIIACEVLKKSYPNGKGRRDEYKGEYWDKLSEDWPYECKYGCEDSIDSWTVVYHNGHGSEFLCKISLDEDALEEIKNAPPQEVTKEK